MKKQSFKKQLTHLLAVTVLTVSSLGGSLSSQAQPSLPLPSQPVKLNLTKRMP